MSKIAGQKFSQNRIKDMGYFRLSFNTGQTFLFSNVCIKKNFSVIVSKIKVQVQKTLEHV